MDFQIHPALIANLGRTPEMLAVCLVRTEAAKEVAHATAPVGTGDDPHPGEFRDSIDATANVDAIGAFGRLLTTDPAGAYIEFGTSDTPAHATLRHAVEATVGPILGYGD